MKTTMKKLAAGTFIALLFMVVNVKAEGTETKASGHEYIESELQLENWMTDETLWNSNPMNFVGISQESETAMEIENWMTNPGTWDFGYNFMDETEPALEIENWMTSEETWNTEVNSDPELIVENWMINSKVWN